MKALGKRYVYCRTIRLTGDSIRSQDLAAVLLLLHPRLLNVKPNVRCLLFRVVDSSKKTRWILWSGRSMVIEVGPMPVRIRRKPQPKTLRIDYWNLRLPSLRKRRTAFRRRG